MNRQPPAACKDVANKMMRSPELEQCCIDNGFCCVDEFDLNGNGDRTEMLGRCEAVTCDRENGDRGRALVAGARSRRRRRRARAQCGKPDLVDMVPPDGATGVPLNAKLGAHYAAAAEYLGEDVVLVHPDGSEQLVAATFWDIDRAAAAVTPTAPLEPATASTRSAGRRCAA